MSAGRGLVLRIPIGVPGPEGPAGPKGDTGPQGPKGDPGVSGEAAVGLEAQNVSGTSNLAVKNGWTYEINATSSATVTFTAPLGTQIAVLWSGSAGTCAGQSISSGQTWVAHFVTSGWKMYQVGSTTPPTDTTPPIPGTLSASAISSSGFTLTVSGASDSGSGLHSSPYAFSTDNGSTWTSYQTSASFSATGKNASTTYQCRARVRDAALNVADTSVVPVTTQSEASGFQPVGRDTFTATDGTLLSAHTPDLGSFSWTAGAACTIQSNKLDIYPYGNTQMCSTTNVVMSSTRFAVEFDYVIPTTTANSNSVIDISSRISNGVSAATGAGNYSLQIGLIVPTGNSTTATLSTASFYDGQGIITPANGHTMNSFPKSGKLRIERTSSSSVSVFHNSELWATVAPASGCSFGNQASAGASPANIYQGAHWTIDNLLFEQWV